ncbi:MAG: tRNA (adenosine(37)-N6)-dimethylallyltransferase MiaA [Desulfobulbaceae bacterium]|nr:tRNA (adenosine(37)-N6)-dimethylallyltransferase MiaA [Desulfobulbaceae bacterium]
MAVLVESDNHFRDSFKLVALIGPTAVGKTRLVLELAEQLGAEVVNIDSMQVYKYMDVGTAKPNAEERRLVNHHLIDLVMPDEDYNVGRFIVDASKACEVINGRNKLPLLTGGTGLYLKGFQDGLCTMQSGCLEKAPGDHAVERIRDRLAGDLLEQGRAVLHNKLAGIDPESAARIHPNDIGRLLRALEVHEHTGLTWSEHLRRQKNDLQLGASRRKILKIGLTGDRKWLYERINLRAAQMLRGGLIEEVEMLRGMGFGQQLKSMQALGYRHVSEFLDGQRDLCATQELMAQDTRHYAKRQLTWFRRDPEITWFEPEQTSRIINFVSEYMDNLG